jgi:hypothetical protein
VGFVVDNVALGQFTCEHFGFSCQSMFPPVAPQSPSSITWGWYNRSNSGCSTKWAQSHPTKKNKKIKVYNDNFSFETIYILVRRLIRIIPPGDGKGYPVLRGKWGHPVTEGYKHGDLVLEVGTVRCNKRSAYTEKPTASPLQ